jgi:hypothetical protein
VVGDLLPLVDRLDRESSRAAVATSAGTTPSAAQASVAASSTSSQVSSFACWVQTAPISGRV